MFYPGHSFDILLMLFCLYKYQQMIQRGMQLPLNFPIPKKQVVCFLYHSHFYTYNQGGEMNDTRINMCVQN